MIYGSHRDPTSVSKYRASGLRQWDGTIYSKRGEVTAFAAAERRLNARALAYLWNR